MLNFNKLHLSINPHNPTEAHLSLAYRNLTTIPTHQISKSLEKEQKRVLKDVEVKLREEEKRERKRLGLNREGVLGRVAGWWKGESAARKDTEDTENVTLQTLRNYHHILTTTGVAITVLDLSNNTLGGKSALHQSQRLNLDFMAGTVHTLILDSNELTHHFKLPVPCDNLVSLSLNNNNIKYLSALVDMLVAACPKLAELSLLKNPCCCNYFQGKELADEKRYRMYVIGRLGEKLRVLDGTQVTNEERVEAVKVFGNWEERLDAGIARERRRSSRGAKAVSPANVSEQDLSQRQEKVRRDEAEEAPREQGESDEAQREQQENDDNWDDLPQHNSTTSPEQYDDDDSDTNADSDVTSYDLRTDATDISIIQSPEPPRRASPPRHHQVPVMRMLLPEVKQEAPKQITPPAIDSPARPTRTEPMQSADPSPADTQRPPFQLPKINQSMQITPAIPPPNPQAIAFQSLIAQNLRVPPRVQDSSSSDEESDRDDDWD